MADNVEPKRDDVSLTGKQPNINRDSPDSRSQER